jgi:hypothetical protein
MPEGLWLVAFIAVYVVVTRWVLPYFGVHT